MLLKSLLALVLVTTALPVTASLTFTGTPLGSWEYRQKLMPSVGESASFFCTSIDEFAGAVSLGYVADMQWGNSVERSRFHIFSTYVTSTTTRQLSMNVDGDDGHSLFVNDSFVGGGGFDVDVLRTVNLQASIPLKIDVVGYNGPGDWVFRFTQQGTGLQVSQIDGITISAEIPEPGSAITMLGCCGLLLRRTVRYHNMS